MSVVIDTNVAIVANCSYEAASVNCEERCIQALLDARDGDGVILVDDKQLIFKEYRKHLSHAGQPGVGDAFFRWLWNNQANPACCRQVMITHADPEGRVFEEFPDSPDLSGFDRSDRKFVAVALVSEENPNILNATDSDWWEFREVLLRHGLRLEFLCQELMPSNQQ